MLFRTVTVPEEGSGQNIEALEACIRRCAAGEREGLADLYQLTRTGVYGFALSIVKNVEDAQDVTQDTFLQVMCCAEGYRSQCKPMAWILTITRNLAMSRLRERSRTGPLPEEGWEPQADGPELTEEDRLTLHALLDTLGGEERQIVTLHGVSGLKFREISALLELPLSTVLSKYHRAMKKLQNTWKEAR